MKKIFIAIVCVLGPVQLVFAEPVTESQYQVLQRQVTDLARTVQQLTLTVEQQSRELASLRGTSETSPAPVRASDPRQGRWNPDIGVVADTVLKLDSPKEDAEGTDRLSVRALELVLGSAVDPYSRVDAAIAFSDFEGAALEEAYYTHSGLPLGITARLGRFKPYIGKALPVHRDSLDTVDEPLVIQRYFGVEGYSKSGADVKLPLDLPWAVTHEAAFGVLEGGNGEDGALFGETRRRPTLYTHLKNYVDLNDATGLEFGVSGLAGSRDEDSEFEVGVIGLDGTLIHRYADRRHLKLQAEVFRVNRNIWGSYTLLDWRFDPRFATGFRFDQVERIDAVSSPEPSDIGYAGYFTFHQSEFARWRLQFTHLDLSDGREDNQVLLQGTFAIGEHN